MSLTLAAVVLLSACGTEPADPVEVVAGVRAPAAVMMGHWEYAKPAPPRDEPWLNAGLIVSFEIDSVAGVRFFGHVFFWLAGDVGVPLEAFGLVTGSTGEESRVSLVIPMTDPSVPAIRVGAVLNGDRLVVQGSWRGVGPGPFPLGSAFVRADAGT